MINWKLRLQNKYFWLTAIGLVNDPTTSGITDSTRALEYKKPSEE